VRRKTLSEKVELVRILLAVHGYPPTSNSGAERQTERMAQWLRARGHEAEVFAIEDLHAERPRVESLPFEGVLVHRLYLNVDDVASEVVKMYDHPRIGDALRALIAERPRFELVHVISGFWLGNQVIRVARAHGIRLVVSLMEFWFMCTQLNLMQPSGALCSGPETDDKCARCVQELSRRYRVPAEFSPPLMDLAWKVVKWLPDNRLLVAELAERRRTLREALSFAEVVICNSRFLLDKFAETGFDTRTFVHIRQGLPGERRPRELRPGRGRTLRLGYLGQLKFHKGVDILVDAVSTLARSGSALSLDMWGPTDEEPAFVEGMKARTDAVPAIRWRGVYGRGGAREVLSELDVVVVPSRWNENSPNVILEAFDMGRPVVTTRLGGMAELVEHGVNGLLFARGDGGDLAVQLQRLVDDRELYERLCAGVLPVRTVAEEMLEVLDVYQRAIGGQGTGPAAITAAGQ
jgi:glycosyltransferase involved in cell wall biosynthesis